MTYNELAELFKREGGDAQVCFSVISQNLILFGNNDTKKDIISFKNEEPIKWVKEAQKEPVSEDLEEEIGRLLVKYYGTRYNDETIVELTAFDVVNTARHFADWKKEQIIERLCNNANIDQMVEKFEDKYKPEKVLDTEYYKRGIFDTIKVIKED